MEKATKSKSGKVAHLNLVSKTYSSSRRLWSLRREPSSFEKKTFLYSFAQKAHVGAFYILALFPLFEATFATTAPLFIVLASIALSLAAFLETLKTLFSDFSSQSFRDRRARLFKARLSFSLFLVLIRLLQGLRSRTGISLFEMTTTTDKANSITLVTCWKISLTILSTLSSNFYNKLKLKFKSKILNVP